MDPASPHSDPDPLAQLEEWGREVERRVGRQHRTARLRGALTARPRRRSRSAAEPRRRAGLAVRSSVAIVSIVVVIAALGGASIIVDRFSARPAGGASAGGGPGSPPAGPFAGTPAAAFAVGAAGFVLPEAHAMAGWSAAAVGDGLERVRAALVAAHLDGQMLIDHDPGGLARLLAPAARNQLTEAIRTGHYGTAAVRIAAGATLADVQPRVDGHTTYRLIEGEGVSTLEVVTNYVIAYAFDGASAHPGDRVVVVHSQVRWLIYPPDSVRPDYSGLWLSEIKGYWHNMSCDAANKGLTAPPASVEPSRQPSASSTESPDAYYRADHPVTFVSACLP